MTAAVLERPLQHHHQHEEDLRQVVLTIQNSDEQERQVLVFCDLSNMGLVWEPRVVVSADLVNSLNEAVRTRKEWFAQIHQQLVICRLGFYCDLWNLRQVIWRMHKTGKRDSALALPVARDSAGEDLVDSADGAAQESSEELPARSDKGTSSPTSPTTTISKSAISRSTFRRPQSLNSIDTFGETNSEDEAPVVEEDLCPVYFFIPELYLDSYELENRDAAIKGYIVELKEEVRRLLDMIEQMGVGSWKQLLQYFLRQGCTLAGLCRELVKACKNPEEVRRIRNNFSNRLVDAMDAVMQQCEVLRSEQDEFKSREGMVENGILKWRQVCYELEDRLRELILNRPPTSEPIPNEEEARLRRRNAILVRKMEMAETWQQKELKAIAELERARSLHKEWQTSWLLLDDGEKDMLSARALELERKARVLRVQLRRYEQREQDQLKRVSEYQEQIAKDLAEIERLRTKLANLPPPDPLALKLKRLQRELKEMRAENEALKQVIAKSLNRIKAMRVELRVLYKKLGWEWDLSDSDTEDEGEKPYWRRRQLAVDGFLPFDAGLFAYAEQGFKHKRKIKRLAEHQAMVESTFQAQMRARRVGLREEDAIPSTPPMTVNGRQEERALSFAAPPATLAVSEAWIPDHNSPAASAEAPGLSSSAPQRCASDNSNLSPVWRSSSSQNAPSWKHNEKELKQRCTQLVQLSRCTSMFDAQLRRIAKHFIDILPTAGHIGRVRQRLDGSLRELSSISMEYTNSLQGEGAEPSCAERQTEALYTDLQECIQEAIANSQEISEVREAMRHAVVFGAIRQRVSEIQSYVRDLRAEVKAAIGYDASILSSKSSTGLTGLLDASHPLAASTTSLGSQGRLKTGRLVPPFLLNTNADSRSDAAAGMDSAMLAHAESSSASASQCLSEEIDFGFRPDGVGEESLENWALFKVSYGQAGGGLGRGQGDAMDRDGMKVDRRVRRQRGAEGSFLEFMSQRELAASGEDQSNNDFSAAGGSLWQSQSPSMPSLLSKQRKKQKGCCSLPELVAPAKPRRGVANRSQALAASPAARGTPPPDHAIDRSWQFGMAPPAA